MSRFSEAAETLQEIDARNGLPEEVFLAVSSLVPIANVDLMVIDEEKGILLSWRDDEYFGRGWHLVGGCIRFKETMLERLQKTALAELGTCVEVKEEPLAVRDVILGRNSANPKIRAHHLAVLYECHLPTGFIVADSHMRKCESGSLRWFHQIPADILPVHEVYFDIFRRYGLMRNAK